MEFFQNIWATIPKWVKNKYFLLFAFFIFWVLIFDNNNLFQLIRRKQTLNQLNQQEKIYQKELEQYLEQQKAFKNDKEALEKFAREEYRMKKDDEDVFVIITEE